MARRDATDDRPNRSWPNSTVCWESSLQRSAASTETRLYAFVFGWAVCNDGSLRALAHRLLCMENI